MPVTLLSGARVLYAPTTATMPSDSDVDYGANVTAWPTGWADAGLTNKPTSINYEISEYKVMSEQSTVAVDSIVTEEAAPIEVGLITWSVENLELAFPGSSTTTQAADATHKAYTITKFGGLAARDTYMWCIEAGKKDAANVVQPVRVFIYQGQARLSGPMEFSKGKETTLELTIEALLDTSQPAGQQIGEIHYITAAKTA